MKISNKTRNELNRLCNIYCGWYTPKKLTELWNTLSEEFDIDILITGAPDKVLEDGSECWVVPFEVGGELVDNSCFIYQVYKGNGNTLQNEYNLYFS